MRVGDSPSARKPKRRAKPAPKRAARRTEHLALKPVRARTPVRVSPRGDTKGASEFRRAERHKATAAYRGAIRGAYTAKPTSQRSAEARQIVKVVGRKGKAPTPEQRVVLHAFATRNARNQELARGRAQATGVSGGELKRVAAFKQTKAYKDALNLARTIGKQGTTQAEREGRLGMGVMSLGQAKAGKAKMSANTTAFEKAAGGLAQGTKATGLFALEQLMRPTSALSRAAIADVKAIQKGKSPIGNASGGEAWKGFKMEGGPTTFSDTLRAAGVENKAARAGGGFALDVALDPLTYLTFGAAVPARLAARGAYTAAKTGGATERAAVAAARAAYEEMSPAAKRAGVRVGARGLPVRLSGKREVQTRPVGGAVTEAIARGVGKAGGAQLGLRGGTPARVRGALQNVSPNVRPATVDPVTWQLERTAAARARAGAREAKRLEVDRWKAYSRRTKGWTPEEHLQLAKAVEAKRVEELPEKLRQVARDYAEEQDVTLAREIGAGLRQPVAAGSRVGGSAPIGSGLAGIELRPDLTRIELQKARRALDAAQRNVGEQKGRRAVLGWRVPGGSKAVGARGKEEAAERLEAARARLREAMELHQSELAMVREQRPKVRDYEAKREAFEQMAEGYFYRPPQIEGQLGSIVPGRGVSKTSTAGNVSAPSLTSRSDPRRLELMDEDDLARYDVNVARSAGQRAGQSRAIVAAKELHDRMAALGRVVDPAKINVNRLDPADAVRLFIDTGHGFKPAVNKRDVIDFDAIEKARAAGRDIVEIDTGSFDRIMRMAMPRGRGQKGGIGEASRAAHEENLYDKSTRFIKTLQTSINASYHTTNLLGDTFNAVLGGVRPEDFRYSMKRRRAESALRAVDQANRATDDALDQLRPRQRKAIEWARTHKEKYHGGEELTTLDLIREAVAAGAVRTGLTAAELRGEVRGLSALADRGTAAKAWDRTQDELQRLNDWREDLIRLTSYRTARKRMSPDEASAWVSRHHFDYADLSPLEQQVLRRLIPFYTFMARNTPLQVRNLVGRPGVMATEEKARAETAKAAEQNPQFARSLREFEQVGVPWIGTGPSRRLQEYAAGRKPTGRSVEAPWGSYPKLPIMDISNIPSRALSNPYSGAIQVGENLLGRSNPLFKTPLELVTGSNFFTKGKQEDEFVPAPSWPSAVARKIGAPDPFPREVDDRTGKMAPAWRWQVDTLSRIIPLVNRASQFGRSSKHGQPATNAQNALNYVGPARQVYFDPRQVKLNQLFEKAAKLRPKIETLKDRNPQLKKPKRLADGSKGKQEVWTGKVKREMDRLKKIEYEQRELSVRIGAHKPSGKPRPVPRKPKRLKPQPIGGGVFGGAFNG